MLLLTRSAVASEIPADAAPAATSNAIVLPADSPMLNQIRRQRVSLRDLPTDEVVAPGKIETNPNRVSKVVLPLAGRVPALLVKTGDAVEKDQEIRRL